jgi:hypothetical protein
MLLELGLLAVKGLFLVQQPFHTDDTDVTAKGSFHFEFSNQYSWLHRGAYPNLRQNAGEFQLNYGLLKHLEVGVDAPLLLLYNAPQSVDRRPLGIGDVNLSAKWNFRQENGSSAWPAVSVAFAVETPTGNVSKQLGSGVADVGFNMVFQKSVRRRDVLRINQGLLFSGNTLTGAVGLKAQGLVYSGSVSVTHQFTNSLLAGAEFGGAVAQTELLGKGAAQTQLGGKYSLSKKVSFGFGVLRGWQIGSPRLALQLGVSSDF